jgi:methionyl-tRNA synthetase
MKPEISYDDFVKIDIRSGMITKSEAVPKSKKLVKLEVFFGPEVGPRTILAGIAGSYSVEGLVGQLVVAVINLAPREIMGETSHGMLLCGHSDDGKPQLVQCFSGVLGSEIG